MIKIQFIHQNLKLVVAKVKVCTGSLINYSITIKDYIKQKPSIDLFIEFMDLAYPSNHDVQISKRLNKADRIRDSIKLSLKKLPSSQILSKRQKQKIIRYISGDYSVDLSIYMNKRAIKFCAQIGAQGSGWNSLHFAVKCNAAQSTEYILKEQYSQYPQQYMSLLNSKTMEGFTPVMLAVIYQSHDVLNLLFSYGGIDIHLIDNMKMTAYELAINYNNQYAIKTLMSHSKRCRIQNKTKLNQPYQCTKKQESCCYSSFIAMVGCLTFGMYSNLTSDEGKTMKSKTSPRRSSMLNIDFFTTQRVRIGTTDQQAEYEIIWKNIEQSMTNKSFPLFNNYNPFDIVENNISIKNNLILLQCLSQHPWLVRKTIQMDRSKPNCFTVNLYINFQYRRLCIDNQIPFIQDREGPMFIENRNQMWPSLLQKGLAKAHQNYFNIESITPKVLIQQLTGFPTFQVFLDQRDQIEIFCLIQQLTRKGYFFIMEGKKDSNLSSGQNMESFSILNIYDKGGKKFILVNCSFIDQAWKEKQQYEMHALKMIRSHISSHNQMCVWIEMQRIKQYFSKIIVSTVLPNYERNSLKVMAKDNIFFTFVVQKDREQSIVFQLINLDDGKPVEGFQIKGYANQGMRKLQFGEGVQGESYCPGLVNLANQKGDYMCHIQLQPKSKDPFFEDNIASSLINSKLKDKEHSYMLIMWSGDNIQPKYLDSTLSPVQFLEWTKLNCIKYWVESQLYRVQVIADYALIIVKQKQCQKMYAQLQIEADDIIQGARISSEAIQLVKQQSEIQTDFVFFYCIVSSAAKYNFNKKASYIKDDSNQDPAGGKTVGKKICFLSE